MAYNRPDPQVHHSRNRAFYKLAQSYPIEKIKTRRYVLWAQKLFAKRDTHLGKDVIEEIISRCENHPMYIQQFLFHLWGKKEIPPSLELIDELELKILRNSINEFLNLWDSLTVNQKKTLKLIIRTSGKDMFYANALQSVDLNAGSQVTRALEKLIRNDIVKKTGGYHIQDVMLKKWIETFLFN